MPQYQEVALGEVIGSWGWSPQDGSGALIRRDWTESAPPLSAMGGHYREETLHQELHVPPL